MTVRSWLKTLQQFTQQARLFLLRCCAKAIPAFDRTAASPETGTDIKVEASGRVVRVMCSEVLHVSRNYHEWIAPLKQLPDEATVADLQTAVEALPGFQPTGQHFFPLATSLHTTPGVNVVQYGRAEVQPSLDWLIPNANAQTEAAVLVIQNCDRELK